MKSLSKIVLVVIALQPCHAGASSAATKLKAAPSVCSAAPTPFYVISGIAPSDIAKSELRAELELHEVIYGAHFARDWDERLTYFSRLNQTGRIHLVHELARDMIEAGNWSRVIELANKHAPGLNRSLIYRRAALAAGRAGVIPERFVNAASTESLRLSNIDYWYSLGVGLTQGTDAAKRAAAMFNTSSPMLQVFLLGIDGNVDGFVPYVEKRKDQNRKSQAAYSYGDIGPAFLMGTLVSKNRTAFNKFIRIELPGTNKTVMENAFRFLRKNDRGYVLRKEILKNVEHEQILSDYMEKQIKLGVFMNDIDVMLDLMRELDITVKQESWFMIYFALLANGNRQSQISSLIKKQPAIVFRNSDIKKHYGLDVAFMTQIILSRIRNKRQLKTLTQILNLTDLSFDQKTKLLNSAEKFVRKTQVDVRLQLLQHALQKRKLHLEEKFQLARLIESVCYEKFQKKRYFP